MEQHKVARFVRLGHSITFLFSPCRVALGEDVERLRDPPQLGVDRLGGDVQHAVVPDG